jgi:valyl-tRNA synthetase
MQSRYENWVGGLNGDWLISRQRFFGVPFPLWYRLDASGEPVFDDPLLPDEADLPIDPTSQVPAGFTADQRNQPGGFAADPDIMDTWATSSLSPQIAGGWEDDPDLFQRVFPFDLRPQAHDIIRTWLFSTVVRSHHEHGSLPWTDTALSGWILDPDRKKMGKSTGNAMTPLGVLEQHGTDAVRYWAANGRLGTDTAFDEGQMKVGRRLAVKLLNASKFALGFPQAGPGPVTEALDRALLGRLADVVDEATTAFEASDYTRALERTEAFFWSYCDDYIELVKGRAYGAEPEAAASANRALRMSLDVLLRLFAPVLPFATEEVWSWWKDGSVHASPWPTSASLREASRTQPRARNERPQDVLDIAAAVLERVRGEKSRAKTSMKTPVLALHATGSPDEITRLNEVAEDLRNSCLIEALTGEATDGPFTVASIELGAAPPKPPKQPQP